LENKESVLAPVELVSWTK